LVLVIFGDETGEGTLNSRESLEVAVEQGGEGRKKDGKGERVRKGDIERKRRERKREREEGK